MYKHNANTHIGLEFLFLNCPSGPASSSMYLKTALMEVPGPEFSMNGSISDSD